VNDSARTLASRILPDTLKNDFVGPFLRYRSSPAICFLPVDPANCKSLDLYVQPATGLTAIHINGKLLKLEWQSSQGRLSIEPTLVEPGENFIGLPYRYQAEEIRLDPVSHNLSRLQQDPQESNSQLLPGIDGYCKSSEPKEESSHTPWMDKSIATSWLFICRSYNRHIGSRFNGFFYACYDESKRSHRLASWIWCSAAVIRALIMQYQLDKNAAWLSLAQETGDKFVQAWRRHRNGVGGLVVRWDVSETSPSGIIPWRAPNDMAFICGYGLLPLYRATGKQEFLDVSREMAIWIIESGMKNDGQLIAGYRDDLGVWDSSWLYVDAGYTATMFQELYELDHHALWLSALRKFMSWYISSFWVDRGYFRWIWPNRFWRRAIFTRGQAWALDGLLATYKATKEKQYLELAQTCADYLIGQQQSDGSWPYIMNRPDTGPCNKGIPILAFHLLRLYHLSGKKRYMKASQLALAWCEKNQFLANPISMLYGGIAGRSSEGAIIDSEPCVNAFLYSSAYFIMAKLQALGVGT